MTTYARGGLFTVTAVKVGAYGAAPWETVPCNPTGGAFTVTLPAGATCVKGTQVKVKNQSASANTITVDPSGANTIDGVAAPGAFTIVGPRLSATLEWDGISDWMVI